MQLPLNLVTDGCKDFLQLDDVALKRLEKYAELLVEWNEKVDSALYLTRLIFRIEGEIKFSRQVNTERIHHY